MCPELSVNYVSTLRAWSANIYMKQGSSTSLSGKNFRQFFQEGFLGPIQVLSAEACQQFLRIVDDPAHPPPMVWFKGHAASSRAFYEIGTNPTILYVVKSFLGDEVMLWGAHVINQAPNGRHPWHTDIETSASPGNAVTVWIGLENSKPETGLTVVSRSHHYGRSFQEVGRQHGKSRGKSSNRDVENWATSINPESTLVRPVIPDGQALFFDGRIWHCSQNLSNEARRALVLQFATPDNAIRIPHRNYLEWPFQLISSPRPPCVLVSGSGSTGVNRFVNPPAVNRRKARPSLTSKIQPLCIPLPPAKNQVWQPRPLFRGSTPNVPDLSCHVSVLHQGQRPHPPHKHVEEELLLVLAGEVDVMLDEAPIREERQLRLSPGQFVYYPAGFPHTLETVSATPANYLMLKWQAPLANTAEPLSFCHLSIFDSLASHPGRKGFFARRQLESPTAYLRKIHCHTSTLTAGAGYKAHRDAHDIVIIVLEGELETLGQRARPHDVIFYRAGEPHGMFNPGAETAKYVVFEFHGIKAN
jgi:mannose-6-phosphate isomerase-like protein (cupin superfamily)